MNGLIAAAEILDLECNATRKQLDADPGNVFLAMRLARLQVIASMVQTFGVGSDIASGYLPVEFVPQSEMDGRSNQGYELDRSRGSVTITNACAPERGGSEADDVSCLRKQLSLPLDD